MLRHKSRNYSLNTCPSHPGPSKERLGHPRVVAHQLCREKRMSHRDTEVL